MHKIQKIFWEFYNGFKKFPNINTVDRSGFVNSDFPTPNNGYIKGWVVDTTPKNIIIVCKHALPNVNPPNNKIFVVDKFGKRFDRTIIALDSDPFRVKEGTSDESLSLYFQGSDITICKLDEPLPDSVKGYKISKDVNIIGKKVVTFHQTGVGSIAKVDYVDKFAYLKGKSRTGGSLIGGDSGTPWYVWENNEWKVLTHTHKGDFGYGPWYSHKLIYPDLLQRITKLQNK
jgi:hypothetical protein